MLLSYFTNYSMPDIWCLEVEQNNIGQEKELGKN